MSPETRQALNKVKAHLRKVGQIADRLAAKDDPHYDLSDIITNLEKKRESWLPPCLITRYEEGNRSSGGG